MRLAAPLLAGLVCALSVTSAAAEIIDPTRPGGAPVVAHTAPARGLQSTLISAERKLAVIDGKRVGIGDSIGGASVVEIGQYHVVLKRGMERSTLKLQPYTIKHNNRLPDHERHSNPTR